MVGLPQISVVIPCRNEVATIDLVLQDLSAQTLGEPFEVIVADGASEDGTRELLDQVVQNRGRPFTLRVVDNPQRIIPVALNLAVAAASGRIIIRIDGHCRLDPKYLEFIVAALRLPDQEVVGPQVLQIAGGTSIVALAISSLLTSKLGTGGTPSRGAIRRVQIVKHTVMSCFRREVWETLGGYDERLLSNEDFDFDYRAGLAGYHVWSLTEPTFRLVARATLGGLCRQRWRYGWWKSAVVRKFPASIHLRQLMPPLALFGFMVLLLSFPGAAVVAFVIYLLAACITGLIAGNGQKLSRRLGIMGIAPLIFAIIHGVWTIGFIYGLIGNRFKVKSPSATPRSI